jgi:hypothetical protein
VDLPVPDSNILCRRAATVPLTRPQRAEGPRPLVRDSTGLKVAREGQWKVRQPGDSPRRTWRKLPLAVAPQTQALQAAGGSEPGVAEGEAVPSWLEPGEDPIERASGDGR